MPAGRRGLAYRSMAALFRGGTSCGLSDAQLLERFLDEDGSGEAAFETLVMRHGSMVLDVCRNVLGSSHDAEDAFQATFLILATKAASVRRRSSVASWLYGVALRTASRARHDADRRRLKERKAAEARDGEIEQTEAPEDFRALHEEIERLPRRYRDPIILCYLEGLTHEMAAAQLRCPVGTVGVRLMRARVKLKERLSRRGAAFAPMVPMLGRSAHVPSSPLILSTVEAAIHFTEAGPVSLAVAQLTREVSKAMLMMKLKGAAAILLVAAMAVSGAGWLTHFAAADAPPEKPAPSSIQTKPKAIKPQTDLEELQGTWITQVEHNYSLNNVPQPAEQITMKWVISGDTIRTFPRPNERQSDIVREDTFLISLFPKRSPKWITLTVPPNSSLLGIYELMGDTLRICYGLRNQPSRFLHDPKHDSFLLTLKRLRRNPEEIVPRFPLDPGRYWAVYPSQPGGVTTTNSLTVMSEFETDHLTVYLAIPSDSLDSDATFHPIAFDADRKPYRMRPGIKAGVSNANVALMKYRLGKDILRGKRITHVGVDVDYGRWKQEHELFPVARPKP